MNTIVLKNLVSNTSSNSQGFVLFNELKKYKQDVVILEISNDLTLSSSFLNSSIGEYLDTFGLTEFKQNIKFKGSRNQYLRISKYLEDYSRLYC